jgi:putative DNA primase/helicase
MVPFAVTIPQVERNQHLDEELKAEWPGILKWMIEGCLEWQRIGLAPPTVVTAATEEYFEAEDTFTQWLEDKCDVSNANDFTPIMILFIAYQGWTTATNSFTGTMKQFHGKMIGKFKYGKKQVDGSEHRGFYGVKLLK